MVEVQPEQIKEVADSLRDVINWVEVFEDEYNLDKEVVDILRGKLEEVAAKMRNLG